MKEKELSILKFENRNTNPWEDDFFQEIEDALKELNPKVYPETYDYLLLLQENDEMVYDNPYQAAGTLLELDKPRLLPASVLKFITDLFLTEIAAGNHAAMTDLGSQYYSGSRGFEQDYGKAMELYKRAAEAGDRQAQENLGYCYYYGRGGEPDYEKAFHFFALGAFDGHLVSMYKIGDMYLNGLYVPKNEREAFLIFIRCAEVMTDEAAERVAGPVFLRLGKMFHKGIGTEQDLMSALVCYQKAETYLYEMVFAGSVMYRESLDEAVLGHEEVRSQLTKLLPC